MSLLQVDDVSKAFGSLVAVRGVSMNVAPGELRAVIGPNGAGKTTFFNLISGLFQPTRGRILFDGEDVTLLAPHLRVARGMARTFQITEIFPELSIAGCLYALLSDFIDPRAIRWDQSGNFVIMAVLGGMRSFWGPLIGAAIFLVLQDYVSSHTENWMSFIGLFFVLIVLFFPRGVLGIIRRKATT